MKSFQVETSKHIEVVDITMHVEHALTAKTKACLVFVPHATAALSIGEYEPNIKQDYEKFYSGLCPKSDYAHNRIDDNAESHILSSLLKPDLLIPVENGKLVLGTWQRILLVDFDGPRTRKIYIQEL